MDKLLFALIENERALDESADAIGDELASLIEIPVGEGLSYRLYKDGSYCVR